LELLESSRFLLALVMSPLLVLAMGDSRWRLLAASRKGYDQIFSE
jgi:hypothetical protein